MHFITKVQRNKLEVLSSYTAYLLFFKSAKFIDNISLKNFAISFWVQLLLWTYLYFAYADCVLLSHAFFEQNEIYQLIWHALIVILETEHNVTINASEYTDSMLKLCILQPQYNCIN